MIEYITEQFSEPNPGFENDPTYLVEREDHKELAGRLIAVHKLHTTARSLETIIGVEEFKSLQDMWAQAGKRYRWSVAFPIIETYEIIGQPKAKAVLGDAGYRRLYQRSSATLRVLNSEEQTAIAFLELKQRPAPNAWIRIEDQFQYAERSEIGSRTQRLIGHDLGDGALEGMTDERKSKMRRRASWLADKFIRKRRRENTLHCDDCKFDPLTVLATLKRHSRTLLDVHHKHPLDEGKRYTTINDFALLCPTCHRLEHIKLKYGKSKYSN